MSMCLLEVAMCGKCRSSHFQSEGGESKKFEDRGGLKNFRTGGVTDLGGGYYEGGGGGGSVPHYMPRKGARAQAITKY